jgi:hypothetical protein
LIIIGGRGDFFVAAREMGEGINKECGRDAVMYTGTVPNAYRFLQASKITIGVGRSAFEGMAYKKPTLVVGEKGYAGTVNEGNIAEISYYNFSGRNNKTAIPPVELAKEIRRLLIDPKYYESVQHFGEDFLRENIDIKAGIDKIEEVYGINALYARKSLRVYRTINMMKILFLILVDNYYNQFKHYGMSLIGKQKSDESDRSPSLA